MIEDVACLQHSHPLTDIPCILSLCRLLLEVHTRLSLPLPLFSIPSPLEKLTVMGDVNRWEGEEWKKESESRYEAPGEQDDGKNMYGIDVSVADVVVSPRRAVGGYM